MQCKVVNTRDGGTWSVRERRVNKDTKWRADIGLRVLEVKTNSLTDVSVSLYRHQPNKGLKVRN